MTEQTSEIAAILGRADNLERQNRRPKRAGRQELRVRISPPARKAASCLSRPKEGAGSIALCGGT
jgi:hypothetical protein